MRSFTPTKPVWSRPTTVTSTTPLVIYLPRGVDQIKVFVDVLSLVGLGDTYAAPDVTRDNEVFTLSEIGAPTGGTFTLVFDDQTTGNINYNDSAANVVTALNALSNVDAGDFTGGGGALNAADVTLTAGGVYLNAGPLPQLKLGTNALTGGTNPTILIRTSTKGGGPTNPFYVLQEANSQEIYDLSQDSGSVEGRQARYLYVATVSGAGNYRVSGYVAG